MAEPEHREIVLKGNRVLAFSDYGAPDGRPLVFCHGAPSSRLAGPPPAMAEALGLRIIAPDRPGIGRSGFYRGRRLTDWPNDLRSLVDFLGLDQFTLLGVSAGGPYALASAAALPDRVRAVGLIASTASIDAPGMAQNMASGTLTFWRLAKYAPLVLETFFRVILSRDNGKDDSWLDAVARALREPDRSLFQDADFRRAFGAMFKEAFRQGPRGPVQDIACIARPWEFDPTAVMAPVSLWQGERDELLTGGRYLARTIPNCRAEFFPEEGHQTLPRRHYRAILQALA